MMGMVSVWVGGLGVMTHVFRFMREIVSQGGLVCKPALNGAKKAINCSFFVNCLDLVQNLHIYRACFSGYLYKSIDFQRGIV